MKKVTTHSKSGLFLMEMIFVLLFLGLTCGICIRLFAASYAARTKAQEYDHIKELTTSVGEILEGTDGSAKAFLRLFPGGTFDGTALVYSFDKRWQMCSQEEEFYRMEITLVTTVSEKEADVLFTKVPASGHSQKLYQLCIRYPLSDSLIHPYTAAYTDTFATEEKTP